MALIIDLTRLSAAYATRLLAEAGHRVVRVEPASGDDVRRAAPFLKETFDLEMRWAHCFTVRHDKVGAFRREFPPSVPVFRRKKIRDHGPRLRRATHGR